MRILIDLRCLQSPPPRGGVARYAEELTRALLARDRTNTYTLFANALLAPRAHLPSFNAPNAAWQIQRLPNKLLKVAHALHMPAGRLAPDIAWLPNLDYIPFLHPRTRIVVSVHDLSFVHFSDCFTLRERAWHRLLRARSLLERATAIVAVSETTRRDLIATFHLPKAKIHVISPGADHHASHAEAPTDSATCCILPASFPYILSLSECSPRKNLDGLIAAFEELQADSDKSQALNLVIAGKHGSATRLLRKQIARSPVRDRIHLIGPVTEHERRTLLNRASCFVIPSFWEGFGFPPLEAMTVGVPVVASQSGALPEVLGDAAEYCDPLDPKSIARAIERVCTAGVLHDTRIARGRERVQRYRWDSAAAQLSEILATSNAAR